MDIAKLKKQVNAYKAHLQRSINSLTEQLSKDEKDRSIDEIKQYLQQVELKYDRWESTMVKIQEDDGEDIDKNIENIDHTLDSVIKVKVQANEIISKIQSDPPKPREESKVPKVHDKMHLPKLEMRKFNGANIEYYQEWYQIFIATIDKSSLSEVEKFIYLKMALEGEAAKLVEGYPVTRENYPLAMGDLNEAYGDPEVVINHHISKLLHLPNQTTPQSLRDLYTSVSAHVRSLDALGVTSQSYSIFLVPIVKSKLNDTLRKEITRKKIKNIAELLQELKEEVDTDSSSNQVKLAFETENPIKETRPMNKPAYKPWSASNIPYQPQPPVRASAQALNASTRNKYCIFCPTTQSHWAEECRRLKNIPPNEVKEIVMKSNACLGCFKKGHRFKDCRMRSRLRCEKCNSTSHNTYLHEGGNRGTYLTFTTNPVEQSQSVNDFSQKVDSTVSTEVKGANAIHASQGRSTIMPIMKARIIGSNGKRLEVNVILDHCSDQSFIRTDVTKELELKGFEVPMEVNGIGGISDGRRDRKEVQTKLYSRSFNNEVDVSLVEMKVICKPISRPAVPSSILNNRNLRNLQLADDYIKVEEKEIHVLIGLDYYYHFVTGRIKRASQQPVAIETVFGWVLVSDSKNQQVQSGSSINTMFISTEIERSLNDDLKKFWELEEAGIEKPINFKNEAAVKKFHDRVKYDPEMKKYTVSLPFIDDDKSIASNYRVAEKQFSSLLKRLEANPDLKEKYKIAMSEYINEGFAELVPEDELYSPEAYYMPHRAVIKEENTTTKTRIVFNASSSARNQASLNDKLLIGPKLHPSIVEILIRWRHKPIALVADIKKMYSMIEVEENDRNSLRFLWIENNEIKHYRHKVLAFGLRSAPYLAIETVQSHIKKFSDSHPEVTESLLDSTYVDDYCHSEETVDEAIDTVSISSQIMTEAGMELRKWQSNEQEVMKHCKIVAPSTDVSKEERKVLGMHWKSSDDYLYYIPKPPKQLPIKYLSKRIIIGAAAQLHDPVGFISPVIIQAKMMIQQLWSSGVEWDENLIGMPIAEDWLRWCEELEAVREIKIDRKYVPANTVTKNQEVHIFNDASEKGYATVAYLRTEDNEGRIHTSLITSKTKVAPLKVVTLPRLELLSALIGSRISLKIKSALKDPDIRFHHWSDSSISLHWIKNTETRWKTFVENRSQEIRENSQPESWQHCPGKENPADIASRGTTAAKLKENSLWWGGPVWLRKSEEHWPKRMNSLSPNTEALKEKRPKRYSCLVANTTENEVIDPTKFSKLSLLLRKTAYLRRFANNCRNKKLKKQLILNKHPTAEEMSAALNGWLQLVQEEYYPEEIARLKAKSPIKQNSIIIQLSPYMDDDTGLLRMQGRVQNAQLTEAEKHPIILPHQSHVVKLLVDHVHLLQLHAGVNQTLITLRNEYWITHARSLVKSIVKSCLVCRIYMPKRLTVPFSPLPTDRVTEAAPFEIIGVDFTGPVHIEETKMVTKRTTKKCPVKVVKVKTTSKAYIALTTCAVTRAIHLELVPDLTTDAFMRSFRRFVSRRGTCKVIYSDNAKTYKCAEKGIKECYEMLNSTKFTEFLAEKSIKWKYICPLSPWWGGYWERLMKTIKIPLKKVLGRSFMNSDELCTVLTEIEAMVNSRPICSVQDDPTNINYLTPANFLIGRSTINLPIRPLTHTEVNPTATRKDLNKMLLNQEKALQKVWKLWKEEYLRSLGTTPAIKEQMPLKEGELVMVASNKQPRCTWSVGRVEELIEGRDGRIRSAIVKVKGKLYTRPVQLLSQLEVQD